jgi:hypothetical protein
MCKGKGKKERKVEREAAAEAEVSAREVSAGVRVKPSHRNRKSFPFSSSVGHRGSRRVDHEWWGKRNVPRTVSFRPTVRVIARAPGRNWTGHWKR